MFAKGFKTSKYPPLQNVGTKRIRFLTNSDFKSHSSYRCIRRLFSKYIIPLQICWANSQSVGTVKKLTRSPESSRHSSSERRCANSVTSISESVSRTTPYNRTIFSCSMECIIAASFKNSIGLDCMRSRLRHLMATWIYMRATNEWVGIKLKLTVRLKMLEKRRKTDMVYPFIAVCPNTLLHDTKFTNTQLLVNAYRIGWYNMFIAR